MDISPLNKHYGDDSEGQAKFHKEMDKLSHNKWHHLIAENNVVKNVNVFRYLWESLKHLFDFQHKLPNRDEDIRTNLKAMISYGKEHGFINNQEIQKNIKAVAQLFNIKPDEISINFEKGDLKDKKKSDKPVLIQQSYTVKQEIPVDQKLYQLLGKYFEQLMGFKLGTATEENRPLSEWIEQVLNLTSGAFDRDLLEDLHLMDYIDELGVPNAIDLFRKAYQMAMECQYLSKRISFNQTKRARVSRVDLRK